MEWQPIETAPKDGEVLVWSGDKMFVAVRGWEEGVWVSNACVDDQYSSRPTHWMPLPDTPTE